MSIIIFILGCILGVLRFGLDLDSSSYMVFDDQVRSKEYMNLEVLIISDPETFPSYQRFVAELHHDNQDIKIQVSSSSFQRLQYGDSLSLSGVLKKPEAFETDNGRTFHYDKYLWKDDVYFTMSYAQIELLEKKSKLSVSERFIKSLYAFKNTLIYHINQKLPEPESGLLAGILFGKKSSLDQETQEQFRIVGLMHIVVLSGYNVSLVIQLVMKVLKFIPLKIRSVLAVCGIISFALLVGAGPTVIRASIMALFLVLAKVLGRRYQVSRALIIAGVIMVIINPKILLFDISFQLSFLATYGLIIFSPIFHHYLRFIPETLELRESAVATLSATLAVTPLILFAIGDISLVSPLVNTLVLFAVPWAMLFGFLTSVTAYFSLFFEPFVRYIAYLFLKYIIIVVELFAKLPYALLTSSPFHVVYLFVMYGLIVLWYFRAQQQLEKRERVMV